MDIMIVSIPFISVKNLQIEPGITIRENASNKGLGYRHKEVRLYQKLGYKPWTKQKEYGMRWPACEGIFSAVKRIYLMRL